MRLVGPAIPADLSAKVAASLQDRPEIRAPERRRDALALDETASAGISVPHQVFTLRLDSIASADPFAEAMPASIGYLIDEGGEVTATADVPLAAAGDERLLPSMTRSAVAPAIAVAIRAAEAADDGEDLYELRVLRVPALRVEAIWFAPIAEGTDQFELIGRTPDEQSPEDGTRLSRDEFVALLRRLARAWTEASGDADADDPLLGG